MKYQCSSQSATAATPSLYACVVLLCIAAAIYFYVADRAGKHCTVPRNAASCNAEQLANAAAAAVAAIPGFHRVVHSVTDLWVMHYRAGELLLLLPLLLLFAAAAVHSYHRVLHSATGLWVMHYRASELLLLLLCAAGADQSSHRVVPVSPASGSCTTQPVNCCCWHCCHSDCLLLLL
jgi:hypothetical protein